jgi:hypothetical protein
MLFLLLESSNILCNHLMYLDYFHIQLVFDLVMDLRKVKYIILYIIILYYMVDKVVRIAYKQRDTIFLMISAGLDSNINVI